MDCIGTVFQSIALFCSIWIVYLLDHYLDAKKIDSCSKERIFHKKNSVYFLLTIGLNFTVGSLTLLFMDFKFILLGLTLSFIVSAYLFLKQNNKLLHTKEIIVALVYAVGIVLPTLNGTPSMKLVISILILFEIAFANLLLFILIDQEVEYEENISSIVTIYGKGKILLLIFILVCSTCSSAFFLFGDLDLRLLLFQFLSFSVFIFMLKVKFARVYKKLLADSVFILPILFV